MLVTNDEEFYHHAVSMRAHGWLRELPENNLVSTSEHDAWQGKFNFFLPGFNLRPLEMSGAIGLQQLKKLPSFLDWRRKNAEILQSELQDIPGVSLQKQDIGGSWMAFALTLEPELFERQEVIRVLEENKFETRPIIAGSFLNQPVMKVIRDSCIVDDSYEFANFVHNHGFMFANHGRDMRFEIESFCRVIQNIASKHS